MHRDISRAHFLRYAVGLAGMTLLDRRSLTRLAGAHESLEHPDPRPGITAEHVLTTETLGTRRKKVLDAYAAARAHPEIFDGIMCACGCSGRNGEHRSLLVCYETMQPTGCGGCQEQALFVGELAAADKSLGEVREAVDKKYR